MMGKSDDKTLARLQPHIPEEHNEKSLGSWTIQARLRASASLWRMRAPNLAVNECVIGPASTSDSTKVTITALEGPSTDSATIEQSAESTPNAAAASDSVIIMTMTLPSQETTSDSPPLLIGTTISLKVAPEKMSGRHRLAACLAVSIALCLALIIGLVVFTKTSSRSGHSHTASFHRSSTSPDSASLCPSEFPSSALCTSPRPSTLRSGPVPVTVPTVLETSPPTNDAPINITYHPGMLTKYENGLLLSQGLSAKVFALTGSRVLYSSGTASSELVHDAPDFGATYPDTRAGNKGGWVYVSNSENRTKGQGGVGAFTFNKNGQVIDYKTLLQNSTANCGGGKTPWGAWISCEETKDGIIYQVDPFGKKKPQVITMGQETNGGMFESFAYHIKDKSAPEFYVTEDDKDGVVRRFIPNSPDWSDPWSILLGDGKTDYLLLNATTKTFRWTRNVKAARSNAKHHFPNTEGIDCFKDHLYFVSKVYKSMYILDLQAGTYTNVTTENGAFDGQPDQIVRILEDTPKGFAQEQYIFFAEDGGKWPGIFARNKNGDFYTILETVNYPKDEPTGMSFSPNGKHLYFALQDIGLFYDITREDGLGFQGKPVNVNYHYPTAD